MLRAREIERAGEVTKEVGTIAGGVVVNRYEGPRGEPGMHEMFYPASDPKARRLSAACGLETDGRFSGDTSGLSIGHVSPEAAAGGTITLIGTGNPIEIETPAQAIRLLVPDAELDRRLAAQEASGPAIRAPIKRDRAMPPSIQAYAAMTTSAARSTVRNVARWERATAKRPQVAQLSWPPEDACPSRTSQVA